MFYPFSLYVGLRYLRARNRNRFISFISFASMFGIFIGIAVLITVLSVMNGFDQQIRARFFAVAPEITITTTHIALHADWKALGNLVQKNKNVTGFAPYVSGKGMLTHDGIVAGAEILGILPNQEKTISALPQKMVEGNLSSLSDKNAANIVLGAKLADQLAVAVGDSVTLLTPETTTTPFGVMPRYKQFTVTGFFKVGDGFGMDDSVAFINYDFAKKLFVGGAAPEGLHVQIQNLYQAPEVADALQNSLPFGYFVSDWTQQYGAFFHALAMEKTMMFLILLLIVAVAAFNLVSGLVMVVNDKRAEIAILQTLGATRKTIMYSFMVQGFLVGAIGIVCGVVAGAILAINATSIVDFIQQVFHVHFISSSVYFIDYVPSDLEWSDVLAVAGFGFLFTVLATLYPAWQAFRVKPATALRYE